MCSQSTLKADFVSSLLGSNSQPQLVINWCLQPFLQPNYPRFWVQFKRLVPGLTPSCESWSVPTLKGVCAWRRDLGSLLPRQGGWERVCIALSQHLPGTSSAASVSALIRRDQMLISSSLLETSVRAVSLTKNRGNQESCLEVTGLYFGYSVHSSVSITLLSQSNPTTEGGVNSLSVFG